MNSVLTLTHNNLLLTCQAIASVQRQDIPSIEIFAVDNGSTDGTPRWLDDMCIPHRSLPDNRGVSWGWNYGLSHFFAAGAEHVLVINNDVRLPSHFYRSLLAVDADFVTGTASDDPL